MGGGDNTRLPIRHSRHILGIPETGGGGGCLKIRGFVTCASMAGQPFSEVRPIPPQMVAQLCKPEEENVGQGVLKFMCLGQS